MWTWSERRTPPAALRTNDPTFTPPRHAELEVWNMNPVMLQHSAALLGLFLKLCCCCWWKHNTSWLCYFKIKAFKWLKKRQILLWSEQSFVRGDWWRMLQGGSVFTRSVTAAEDRSIISSFMMWWKVRSEIRDQKNWKCARHLSLYDRTEQLETVLCSVSDDTSDHWQRFFRYIQHAGMKYHVSQSPRHQIQLYLSL